MLSTNYLQWLIKRGLVITRVHEWVTFDNGKKPFHEFMNTMCDERRKGDVLIDGQKPFKLLGETAKVISVSCYGKLLERKLNPPVRFVFSVRKLVCFRFFRFS